MSFQNWTRLSTTIGESLSLGTPQLGDIFFLEVISSDTVLVILLDTPVKSYVVKWP